jgi:Clostridium P-47 protein
MATTMAASAVYTHGWDTVFGIPVTDVNQAIVDKKSSPPTFSFADSSGTFTLEGTFGDWQITNGGDGKEIRMTLPVTTLHFTYLATKVTFEFTGNVVLAIELHYIPHQTPEAADPKDGSPFALVVRSTSDDPTQPVAFVVSSEFSPTPGTVTNALIAQGFKDWAAANLAVFNHIFAVVNLNRMVDTGKWSFVTPNYTSYAYLSDGTGLQADLFGVLSMTGDRSGAQLNEQIAQNTIPTGAQAGFLVSQRRALENLIRPAIMQAYTGLTDANFLLNDEGDTLYLTEGTSVGLKPVAHDGSNYYPKLTNLSVKSNGEVLTLTSHTETEIVEGITAICQSTHWFTVKLGSSSKGQTLNFAQYQEPSIVHSINQSEGSHITQLIIAIVAAVVLLLLVILTDGAALVVGGLVIGLLLGADQIVPALIEDVNKDDSPSIDLLLANAVSPIVWTASGVFKLTYASLNNSLQLGGDPQFL